MRSLITIAADLRDLSGLLDSAAEELESIAALFSGGAAEAKPKPPFDPGAPEKKPRSQSYKGVRATEPQKLLVRQLWFSLPPAQRTKESKRAIARQVQLPPQIVATIIFRTPKEDLSNFLKTQGQSL